MGFRRQVEGRHAGGFLHLVDQSDRSEVPVDERRGAADGVENAADAEELCDDSRLLIGVVKGIVDEVSFWDVYELLFVVF